MTDKAPGQYEEATRRVACVALGEAMAARQMAAAAIVFLVEGRLYPRDRAVELLDLASLRMEEIRPTAPTMSADMARDLLLELAKKIGQLPLSPTG